MRETEGTEVRLRAGLKSRRVKDPSRVHTPAADKNTEVPRVTRLLALAHQWNGMIERGEIENQAEIARRLGLTRARVTQIMELRWLCPAFQNRLLVGVESTCSKSEKSYRRISRSIEWNDQFSASTSSDC